MARQWWGLALGTLGFLSDPLDQLQEELPGLINDFKNGKLF